MGSIPLPLALAWLRLPLFAAALGYWVLPDPTTEKWMLRGLIGGVAFMALDTLWQFHSGADIFGHPIFMSEGFPRLTGPFKGPRVGLTIVWLLFPALAGLLAATSLPRPARLACWAGLMIAASLAIYVSGERTAFVMLALGFGLTFLLTPAARLPLLAAVAVALLAGWQLAAHNPQLVARQVNATHDTVASYWDTVYGRTWISATKVTLAHPVFGVGIHQFQAECAKPEYGPNDEKSLPQRCPIHPHNMYLSWAVNGGFIALGLFCAMVGCWAVTALKHWRQWYQSPVAAALLIVLAIRLVPVALAPNQLATWVLVPLWFFVGWLLAFVRTNATTQSAA